MALTACDGGNQEVTPTSTTKPPPTTSSTTLSAPSVANPLDANDFVANPCLSLSEAQQKQYGFTGTDPGSENCFFTRGTTDSLLVSFDAGGLKALYETRGPNDFGKWQPTELDGYPAVALIEVDNTDCALAVGISDSLYFTAFVTYDETCADSKKIARTILTNIKAAN